MKYKIAYKIAIVVVLLAWLIFFGLEYFVVMTVATLLMLWFFALC